MIITFNLSIIYHMKKVALIIENSRGFGRSLLRGIAQYAAIHGPWTFYRTPAFYLYPRGKQATSTLLKELIQWKADGFIMREVSDMEHLLELGIPTVLSTYRLTKPPKGIAEIYVDNYNIGVMAAEHLMERGYRKFAFCGYQEFFWSKQRYEGFKAKLEQSGFSAISHELPKRSRAKHWDAQQNIICRWLKTLPRPIGLMACIDEYAQDILEACKTSEIHIPEEMAIISGDNDELICDLSTPRLSSVAINGMKAGYKAAQLLDDLMAGRKPESMTITVSPTHVATRTSTDTIAVSDSAVSEAIRFIRENTNKLIQVSDVADAVMISRRVLEQRFRKHLNCSIYNQIKRSRINLISTMLLKTDMSINDIAHKAGFESGDYLYRFFRQEKGVSPATFRKNSQGIF